MKNYIFVRVVLFVTLTFLFFSAPSFAQTETAAALSVKMDQVLENQKVILAKLDELKQELHIVKLRATR